MQPVGAMRILLASLFAILLAGTGCMMTNVQPKDTTALHAVRGALPLLRDRHHAGQVVLVESDGEIHDGTAKGWIIHVWDPEAQGIYQYEMQAGRLSDVGLTGMHLADRRPIVAQVGDGDASIAQVLDSDAASVAAASAGAGAFQQKTGAGLLSMALTGGVGEDLHWSMFYSRPYSEHRATFELDARSGTVVGIDSDDPSVER